MMRRKKSIIVSCVIAICVAIISSCSLIFVRGNNNESGNVVLLPVGNGEIVSDSPVIEICDTTFSSGTIVVQSGSSVIIKNCTFSGITTGAIRVDSKAILNLENCNFDGNGTFLCVNAGANATVENCTFSEGVEFYESDESAIMVDGGTLNFVNSTIKNCSAARGGAINVLSNGICNISGGTTISGCWAYYGGAICVDSGALNIDGAEIDNCYADFGGGGIYNGSSKTLNIKNVKILNSCTNESGGAIYSCGHVVIDDFEVAEDGSYTAPESVISNCKATSGNGGAIYSTKSVSTAKTTIFDCEATSGNGGAIYAGSHVILGYQYLDPNYDSGIVEVLQETTISNCKAGCDDYQNEDIKPCGGGVYSNDSVMFYAAKISDCYASDSGGAVYANHVESDCYEFSLTGQWYGIINNCKAENYGGGIFSNTLTGKLNVSNCEAMYGGGLCLNTKDIYLRGATLRIQYCEASVNGGGIYAPNGFDCGSLHPNDYIKVSNCTAENYGGGMYMGGSSTEDFVIDKIQIYGECKALRGGGIYFATGSKVVVQDSSIGIQSDISSSTGNSAEYGGGIYSNKRNIEFINTKIDGNTAHYQGGGLWVTSSTVTTSNSSFSSNQLAGEVASDTKTYGAGIYAISGTFTCNNNTRIQSNTVTTAGGQQFGGGMFFSGSKVYLNSVSITDNKMTAGTSNRGAGVAVMSNTKVYIGESKTALATSVFISRNQSHDGAGFTAYGGEVTFNACTISENVGHTGGGVWLSSGTKAWFDGSYSEANGYSVRIVDNTATSRAGGLNTGGTTIDIACAEFSGNKVVSTTYSGYAGGLYVGDKATMNISGGLFANNSVEAKSSSAGGGIYLDGTAVLNVSGGTISNNSAETTLSGFCSEGGNIAVKGTASLNVTGGSITGDGESTLAYYGGGIYIKNGTYVSLSNAVISECVATSGGGVYSALQSEIVITDCTISENTAKMSGGALFVNGDLSIVGGSLNANKAENNGGAIYSTKGVNITGTTINGLIDGADSYLNANNGGAIYNTSTNTIQLSWVTISNCRVSDSGGAIYVPDAVLEIDRLDNEGRNPDDFSTISNCSATGNGGAIFAYSVKIGNSFYSATKISGCISSSGNGGAINAIHSGVLEMVSISECSAVNGGGVWSGGNISYYDDALDTSTVEISDCEASDSGGGIYSLGSIDVVNLNVANNKATNNGGGIYIKNSSLTTKFSLQYNYYFSAYIVSNEANNGGGIYAEGSSINNVELTNNKAIGNGGGIYALNSTDIELGSACNNSAANGGTMYLDNSSLTLIGNYSEIQDFVSTATEIGGYAYLDNGSTLNMQGQYNLKDNSAKFGGAIYLKNKSVANINANFTNCDATSSGGAIYATDSTINITGGTISGSSGSAIYAINGTNCTIQNATINNCSSTSYGGAIEINGGSLSISSSSTINGCSAAYGGGIYSSYTAVEISGSTISSNTATHQGGGLHITGGTLTIDGVTVSENIVTGGTSNENSGYGGGIYLYSTTATIDGESVISGNKLETTAYRQYGSGILVRGSTLYLYSATISGNTAKAGTATSGEEISNRGGGVAVMSGSVVQLGKSSTSSASSVVISNNTSHDGAGFIAYGGKVTFYACTISGNKGVTGGGLWLSSGVDGCFDGSYSEESGYSIRVINNMATSRGGALNMGGTTVDMYAMEISGNTVKNNDSNSDDNSKIGVAGGIYVGSGVLNIYDDCLISGNKIENKTSVAGGGIYIDQNGNETGTVNMYGGKIHKNIADPTKTNSMGGNVVIRHGAFNMFGGVISGDGTTMLAKLGGGIANLGVLNISGGTIEKCVAEYGGGIGSYGGFELDVDINLIIKHYEYYEDFRSNVVNISGSSVIKNNVATIGSAMSVGNVINFAGTPDIDGTIAIAAQEAVKFLKVYTIVDPHYPTINVSLDGFDPVKPLNFVLTQAKIEIEDVVEQTISYSLTETTTMLDERYITNNNYFINYNQEGYNQIPECANFIVNDGAYGHINELTGLKLTKEKILTISSWWFEDYYYEWKEELSSSQTTLLGGKNCKLTVEGNNLYKDGILIYTAPVIDNCEFIGFGTNSDGVIGEPFSEYTLTGDNDNIASLYYRKYTIIIKDFMCSREDVYRLTYRTKFTFKKDSISDQLIFEYGDNIVYYDGFWQPYFSWNHPYWEVMYDDPYVVDWTSHGVIINVERLEPSPMRSYLDVKAKIDDEEEELIANYQCSWYEQGSGFDSAGYNEWYIEVGDDDSLNISNSGLYDSICTLREGYNLSSITVVDANNNTRWTYVENSDESFNWTVWEDGQNYTIILTYTTDTSTETENKQHSLLNVWGECSGESKELFTWSYSYYQYEVITYWLEYVSSDIGNLILTQGSKIKELTNIKYFKGRLNTRLKAIKVLEEESQIKYFDNITDGKYSFNMSGGKDYEIILEYETIEVNGSYNSVVIVDGELIDGENNYMWYHEGTYNYEISGNCVYKIHFDSDNDSLTINCLDDDKVIEGIMKFDNSSLYYIQVVDDSGNIVSWNSNGSMDSSGHTYLKSGITYSLVLSAGKNYYVNLIYQDTISSTIDVKLNNGGILSDVDSLEFEYCENGSFMCTVYIDDTSVYINNKIIFEYDDSAPGELINAILVCDSGDGEEYTTLEKGKTYTIQIRNAQYYQLWIQ